MKTSKASLWIAGTIMAALVLVAGGWFGLVSPALAQASETRTQASTTADANVALNARIVTLKKQYESLSTYRADLAALRQQIPSTADTANLLREMQVAASSAGITLISVTPGSPVAATNSTSSTATDTTMSGAGVPSTSTSSSTGTTSTPSATAAATSAQGLVAIPLNVDMVGSYAGALDFLNAVQSATGRLYYVTGLTVAAQQVAGAGGGHPATNVGDAELQLTGYVFVLPESTTTPAANPSATTPLPAAVPGKNPLVPVG